MKIENEALKPMFDPTDSIVIIDSNGKVLYYEDYNDQINMIRYENAIGKSIYELYPFFKREDFTVFEAIDSKSVILNKFQQFEINGIPKKSLNSAYPLINETGVIGCIVTSVSLDNKNVRTKKYSVSAKYNFEDIITCDSKFIASFDILKKLAISESNILVSGETGTGKELIAHTIHANSPRKKNPFIIQNCAAIPDNLMESILFGSSKGSFTGATDRQGLFETSEGGTLYLDEMNSLSLDLQAKLLRAIDNKSIRRIGESKERITDVRIIASTNESLSEMVKNQQFRKDLYYRLNVASYSIMPLRERKDDIPLLCNHYIRIYNDRLNHNITGVNKAVADFFNSYYWDGNVRELKNVVEYVCTIKKEAEITINDLPNYMFNQKTIPSNIENLTDKKFILDTFLAPGDSLKSQLELLEKEIMKKSILHNKYSITKTANELEISRQTLYTKLKKYDLL
ncbi:MAG: sigma 54-interacting transcriptional regulator [Peptostreptococcaceae bacterium]|nr:sigma 54-interacting transcriptional regulator [Peptostreptococcaceae bacterium]